MRKIFLLLALLVFSSFSYADANNANDDYSLGVGDMVRVTVYGNPDLTTEARISAAGEITFPLVGVLKLGGITPSLAEKKIALALEGLNFVKQPQVNLVVLQYQSQLVSVLGNVLKPGRYPLDRPTSLTDVLALAGGVTPTGSEIVSILSSHSGKSEKKEYDLREILARANDGANPKVGGDDIVYVRGAEISVLGQVNRPGKYSIGNGLRTLVDFLSGAGGIASSGADTLIVMSQRGGKQVKHEIDIDQLFRSGNINPNFELADGDVIYVPRAPTFYVYGEVQRPGAFRLEHDMTIAQALSSAGGLSARGTERRMRIKRRDGSGELKTFDTNPGDLLQADDVVYVDEKLF